MSCDGRRRGISRTNEVRDGSCQLVAERQREGRTGVVQ